MDGITRQRLLTKTGFTKGLDCPKKLWLDEFASNLKAPLSLSSRDRMETGTLIGKLARNRYPGGQTVPWERGQTSEEAAERTAQLIREGAECLFEATFIADGCLAKTDVLWREGDGWCIDEVKSSTVKEPKDLLAKWKTHDLAFQIRTLRRAGLEVNRGRLVLIDSKYVWSGGDYDYGKLFGAVELTEQCEQVAEDVEVHVAGLKAVLNLGEAPLVDTNRHCDECDYYDHCHRDQHPHDVVFFPLANRKIVEKFRALGYRSIDAIPPEHELSPGMKRAWTAVVTGKAQIGEELGRALASISFPAAFIDFESCMPALPRYEGTRPYMQTCFQWSAHFLYSPDDASPEHKDFLHEGPGDPRPAFCESLWKALQGYESVLHYAVFEKVRLKEMAEAGIPYAAELAELLTARAVDLHKIVKEHVYFAEFKGKTSIKVVLPVLVPTLSYEGMPIADGTSAAIAFMEMVGNVASEGRKAEIRQALLDYCRLDTLAMVEIYQALRLLKV